MADASFDVVSKIDRMELDNAINQAIREIDTRFDFKNTGTSVELAGEAIKIEAGTEERAKAALEVVKEKMIKRGVSLKHLDSGEPALSGKIYKIACTLKEGISTENAKKVAKTTPVVFHAHRDILSECSTGVLADICRSSVMSSSPIEITDVSQEVFPHLLYSAYGVKISDEDMKSQTKEIIEAANKYGVVNLKLEAEACFVKDTVFS